VCFLSLRPEKALGGSATFAPEPAGEGAVVAATAGLDDLDDRFHAEILD